MAVVFKTLSATLAANVNELTFTDAIINSNSVIEVYYNSNDVYTVETWQDGTTIGIVTSDHNFPVGVKVTINNVISFEPYDDTDLVNRIGEDETAIGNLSDRLGIAEGDIDDLELSVESLSTNKQDVLTAGNNITIENNIISASGGIINYSTSEQDTGIKWIDGKTVYQKTIVTGALTKDNSWHSIPLDLNIDTVIDVSAVHLSSQANTYQMIPNYRPNLNQGFCLQVTSTSIDYVNNWVDAYVNDAAYFTLRYTKQ